MQSNRALGQKGRGAGAKRILYLGDGGV